MTDHAHAHPLAHKEEAPAKAKTKTPPEPIKFSLIQYKDNEALAVESGDLSKSKHDGMAGGTVVQREISCLGVYDTFDAAHAELVTKGQERADKEKKETEAAKKKADK